MNGKKQFIVCDSMLKYSIFLLMMFSSVNSYASTPQTNGNIRSFTKSDIFIMYNEEDRELLKNYKVDNISWGNQIIVIPAAIEKRKTVLHHQRKYGIKLNSVGIPLIQEGGKYVICGSTRGLKCAKMFHDFKSKNNDVMAQLQSELVNINKRAVLDAHGKIVGVPWLLRRGMTVPMASVNDPGYKKWLINKIDGVLRIEPNAIHFDEPAMESVAIKTRRPFGLTTHSLQEFNRYLKNTKEPGWKPDGIQQLAKFDYKKLILATRDEEKNTLPPLWKEFAEFKVSSTVKLFGDLVAYAKEQADWPLLISANASPNDWKTIPLIQYLDFIAAEVSQQASKLEVPSTPLYVYKMAEALNKPIVSTALGTDWAVIKKDEHILLACSWIAQAYAAGQYMNFPLKAWVPGSTYQPQTSIYPQLSGWIKEKGDLFDGYKTIATHALVVSAGVLRSHKDRGLLVGFTKKLIEQGVQFKIILEQEEQKIYLPVSRLQDYESLISVLPEYFSEDAITKIQAHHVNNMVWEPSRAEMRMGSIKPEFTEVRIPGETGVFGIPRKNLQGAVVLHLLNREYLPDSKRMKTKGPFHVKVSKKIFNPLKIKSAILHQPALNEETSPRASVNVSSRLTVKDDGEYLTVTVPSLDLWGIVEFISF